MSICSQFVASDFDIKKKSELKMYIQRPLCILSQAYEILNNSKVSCCGDNVQICLVNQGSFKVFKLGNGAEFRKCYFNLK